jgi:hypothetical protein
LQRSAAGVRAISTRQALTPGVGNVGELQQELPTIVTTAGFLLLLKRAVL